MLLYLGSPLVVPPVSQRGDSEGGGDGRKKKNGQGEYRRDQKLKMLEYELVDSGGGLHSQELVVRDLRGKGEPAPG